MNVRCDQIGKKEFEFLTRGGIHVIPGYCKGGEKMQGFLE